MSINRFEPVEENTEPEKPRNTAYVAGQIFGVVLLAALTMLVIIGVIAAWKAVI